MKIYFRTNANFISWEHLYWKSIVQTYKIANLWFEILWFKLYEEIKFIPVEETTTKFLNHNLKSMAMIIFIPD